MNPSRQALSRLAAIGLIGGLLQLAAVSQIAVLGVPADLGPLLAAFVGLLGGSLAGATFGFAFGLLIDVALLQTIGVTSLVLTGVGYAAGRLLELRDPAHGLVPLMVGGVATAVYAVAVSLIQFLLGVEAPVSVELLRQIVSTALITTLLALPVHAVVKRALLPVLPDQTRRRRRQTRPGLSPLISP